ncbi:MAG: hypothetical protein AAB574_01260 [Patescibacteria group bacterium]
MASKDVGYLLTLGVVHAGARRRLTEGDWRGAIEIGEASFPDMVGRISLSGSEQLLITIGGTLTEIARRFIPSDIQQ